MKTVLHIGAGGGKVPQDMFPETEWEEVSLDINPDVKPDIIASSIRIDGVSDNTFDAAYSSHSIEHLYAYEVPWALAEMYRVIKPGGAAVIICPDLLEVARCIVNKGLTATAYECDAGAITPLDMLYGHVGMVAAGNEYMQHRCGFTAETIRHEMECEGFKKIQVITPDGSYEMCTVGWK
jgi:ubiquinone/menaquinone biosynthesis C-methylase UbiE